MSNQYPDHDNRPAEPEKPAVISIELHVLIIALVVVAVIFFVIGRMTAN